MVFSDRFTPVSDAVKQLNHFFSKILRSSKVDKSTTTMALHRSRPALSFSSISSSQESNGASILSLGSSTASSTSLTNISSKLVDQEDLATPEYTVAEDESQAEPSPYQHQQEDHNLDAPSEAMHVSSFLVTLSSQVLELISEMKPEDIVPELTILKPRLEAYANAQTYQIEC